VEALARQFGENELIAQLESRLTRFKREEGFFALNSLAELVRRSTSSTIRQRYVEQILTGGLETDHVATDRDWLLDFAESDFNAASRAFLLDELDRTKDGDPYAVGGPHARWAGIAGIKEAMPVLREINDTQRMIENRTHNPLFMRSALIALGRMDELEAVREIIECIERIDDPKVRALSLQRLTVLRTPEVVEYLRRYLLSDVVHAEAGTDWLPVSEARCAADALREMLAEFPDGPLDAQRTWMEGRTDYAFSPVGTESIRPGRFGKFCAKSQNRGS